MHGVFSVVNHVALALPRDAPVDSVGNDQEDGCRRSSVH